MTLAYEYSLLLVVGLCMGTYIVAHFIRVWIERRVRLIGYLVSWLLVTLTWIAIALYLLLESSADELGHIEKSAFTSIVFIASALAAPAVTVHEVEALLRIRQGAPQDRHLGPWARDSR